MAAITNLHEYPTRSGSHHLIKTNMIVFNTLIALSAACAIHFGLAGNTAMFSVLKPLTTIIIICALLANRQHLNIRLLRILTLALLACLAGDVLLLDETRFVAGLAAFLIGHLLLIRVFVLIGGWSWAALPLVVLTLLGGGYFWYLTPHLGAMTLPVALYSSVIILMAWQGVSLALKSNAPGSSLLAVGALLFMFSDAMIALNKFVVPFELSTLVILSTYWLSLTLILNAILFMAKYSPQASQTVYKTAD